jgi:hypothetical protein
MSVRRGHEKICGYPDHLLLMLRDHADRFVAQFGHVHALLHRQDHGRLLESYISHASKRPDAKNRWRNSNMKAHENASCTKLSPTPYRF